MAVQHGGVEAGAVVGDGQLDVGLGGGDGGVDAVAAAVFGGVADGFLGHPEKSETQRTVLCPFWTVTGQNRGGDGLSGVFDLGVAGEVGERAGQPDPVQDRWVQVRDQAA